MNSTAKHDVITLIGLAVTAIAAWGAAHLMASATSFAPTTVSLAIMIIAIGVVTLKLMDLVQRL